MEDEEFLELLDEQLFISHMEVTNKEEAIKALVDCLVQNRRVRNGSIIVELIQRREQLGSTGIGDGVAIPHGRSVAVEKLTVVFANSTKGIDYGAIDGKPVNLFFLVLAPPQEPSNRYLPFLGKLVEILRDVDIRDGLTKVNNFQELKEVISGYKRP